MISKDNIKQLEEILKYTFHDKNLLITAMTHSSYSNEHNTESNEKLEFLGDSILNFLVAEKLFSDHLKDEGLMTIIRSKMVSRQPLAYVVDKLGLVKYIRFGMGIQINNLSIKARSNFFESLIAAIYLDGGLDNCRRFIFENIKLENIYVVDYKTIFLEYLQSKKKGSTFAFQDSFVGGEFLSKAVLDGAVICSGKGKQKKEAQQQAAKILCQKYKLI